MSSPRSVLELLHPEGRAPRLRVVGSACPPELWVPAAGDRAGSRDAAAARPTGRGHGDEPGEGGRGAGGSEGEGRSGPGGDRARDDAGPADLVILVPDAEEGRDPAWRRAAARRSAAGLAPDGLVYLLAPLRLRLKLSRLLRAEGLEVRLRIVHRPHWRSTRYMVPLRAGPLRFAFSALLPARPGARSRLLGGTYRAAAAAGLGSFLPGVAEIATAPGTRRPMEWLAHVPEDRPGEALGVLRVKVRGDSGRVVILRIPAGANVPSHVLKTVLGPDARAALDRETETLTRLRGAAERAGARLPRATDVPSRPDLRVQTAVAGRPASVLLARCPSHLDRFLEDITGWLAAWHRESRREVRLDEVLLRRHVLAPAAALLGRGGREGAYLGWLEARAEALLGRTVPLVATHNDLTMENVIVADGRPPGVVDWATGDERALPLGDFYYAVVDAVATAEGHRDRVRAVRDCFTPEGHRRGRILDLETRVSAAAGTSPEFAVLCFHACWLHHAVNERAKATGRREGPFRDIVRWQARRVAAGAARTEAPRA